jgi:hypothetical protein
MGNMVMGGQPSNLGDKPMTMEEKTQLKNNIGLLSTE